MGRFKPLSTAPVPERAILVGVDLGRGDWPIEESLAELARLAETDGAEVVHTMVQRLDAPVPRTFIGSGKAQELVRLVGALEADVVIFDDELTPSQQSNLERIVGEPTKVIDRTALILDIFGEHARTHEGRLQVQLAQLQYVLPRLRGMWSHLVGEQTRGGIGGRFGQGESQLEVDRRLVRRRISWLRRELKQLELRRSVQSKARWDSGVYRVALVGYTNAGKSTLLNQFTNADVYAKDELFATLDPTTRSLELEEGRKITITDTVGFIQKLPTTLIESFKSTLAEVRAADLVLLVVDAHDPNAEREIVAVRSILSEIGAEKIPSVVVYNKCDKREGVSYPRIRPGSDISSPDRIYVCAKEEASLQLLTQLVCDTVYSHYAEATFLIPYADSAVTGQLMQDAHVSSTEYKAEGTLLTARCPRALIEKYKKYCV